MLLYGNSYYEMFFKMANLKFAQKLSNFFRDYRRIEKTGGENTLI